MSVSNVIIYGNNTFNELYANANTTQAVIFAANSNTTVTTWSVRGTDAVDTIILTSTSTWRYGLIKSGGGIVSADYLNINYSNATPSSNVWYAGANSVDGGTNTGWIFTAAPGGAPAVALRLTNTGNLLIASGNIFDEITQSTISIRPAVMYAAEFDEFTLAGQAVKSRFTSTGNVQIAGELDEISGIV